jgi:hypothetical protein
MSTIVIHSDRYGGRAIGQPRTGHMGPGRDPVMVAREARRLIQSGDWQRLPAASDRKRILALLQARLPAALGLLPLAGLYALGKQPPAGGCHWCAALVQVLPDRLELERTPITLALLGDGCNRCQARWQVDARVAALVDETRERERLAAELCRGRPWLAAALAASAHGPESLHAQMDRDCWGMGAQRAAVRWGVPVGLFLGDHDAIREVGRHPVFGPALRRWGRDR